MNGMKETIFDQVRKTLSAGTILKTLSVESDSMAYEGRNSVDIGDEIIGTRFGLKDLEIGSFIERDVFIIKFAGQCLLRGISAFNAESLTILLTAFNPDKVRFPDLTVDLADVESIHKVIKIGKFRGFDQDEERP